MALLEMIRRDPDTLQVNLVRFVRFFTVVAKDAHQSLGDDGQYRASAGDGREDRSLQTAYSLSLLQALP